MAKGKIKKVIARKKTVSKDDIAITNAINNKLIEQTEGYVDNVFVKPETDNIDIAIKNAIADKNEKKATKVKQYIDDVFKKPKNG
jgi:hypothetical protein